MGQEEKGKKPRVGIANLERRRYPRFAVDLPIEYHRLDIPNGQSSRVLNASAGGLLVYLPEEMEIGQQLKMKLFFSFGTELNTIEMVTEVAWMDLHLGEGWGDYRSGVRIIDISPEDMKKLKDFLVSLST